MELVEDLGAEANKCSYINEYINFFCNVCQDHPLTFNQKSGFIQMMSLTFGLFIQVSDSGPQGPLVISILFIWNDPK